jgi:predicted anti-sigma-YlaC factor YlaD
MHSCECYREALSARLDGEHPGIAEDVIDAHLVGCADCRAWVAAAEDLGRDDVFGDVPVLRAGVMNEILGQGPGLARRRRPATGWRIALLTLALLQLVVAWPGLLLDEGSASAHTVNDLASWDLGLAVSFLVLAWLPWRAWGALPVVAVMVIFLAGTAASDLLRGQADLSHEAAHVLQVAGLICLWMIARRMPRSSVVLRLNAP